MYLGKGARGQRPLPPNPLRLKFKSDPPGRPNISLHILKNFRGWRFPF